MIILYNNFSAGDYMIFNTYKPVRVIFHGILLLFLHHRLYPTGERLLPLLRGGWGEVFKFFCKDNK
jgi:hypothetical protein